MGVDTKIIVRLLVMASLIVLFRESSACQEPPAKNPVKVTILDLASHARQYDGQLLQIEGLLALSWEGDNFLSEPNPQRMPPDGQAYVWFYCKPEHQQEVFTLIMSSGHGSVYGSFTGYFHFVEKPHVINGAFYPGQLQFEAIRASVPDPQRMSLAEAIRQNKLEVARKIVRSGAKLNVWDEDRSLPLIQAIRNRQTDFAEELLEAGAEPNVAGDSGDRPLLQAAWSCNLKIAKSLLQRGADVNATEVNGETALKFAAQTCADGQMVHFLLEAGADPKAKVNEGALMAAAGNPRVVEKLLAAGADPTLKDKYGNTVESKSCDRGEKGHYEVCQLVREALRNAAAHSKP
jgi:ankyrin repeat protein